ncbi:MAG: DUF126 domain-containing protein [Acidobacteriota bacterium]
MRFASRRVLVSGTACGPLLVFDEPLSLWGGYEPQSGEIIDRRHPLSGVEGAGKVWCMPHGRGSSSASSILLESVRAGTAPAALLLREEDGILSLGAAVAREIYGRTLPVLLLGADVHEQLCCLPRAEIEVRQTGELIARELP